MSDRISMDIDERAKIEKTRRIESESPATDDKVAAFDPIIDTGLDRVTGLTKGEYECHKSLMDAYGEFCRLPQQHPDELREFVDCVHRMQNLLTIRIARRHWPKGWPSK